MEVNRKNLSDGACSFCDKGVLAQDRVDLDYPYSEVTQIVGRSFSASTCDECALELIETLISSLKKSDDQAHGKVNFNIAKGPLEKYSMLKKNRAAKNEIQDAIQKISI